MKKLSVLVVTIALVLLLGISGMPVLASAPTLPPGFKFTLLADGLVQPKGIVSALHRAGAGQFGHDLYVAESGTDQIVTVDKRGTGSVDFASVGDFPVGVAFCGGKFGEYLYVGNAYSGGIDKVDLNGTATNFALPGMSIAGLDFGRGPYGGYLYAGEYPTGKIWKVDPAGNATLFASGPGETRYLKFSHGNGFGTFLYYTDAFTGNIYKVDPSGTVSIFASTSTPPSWGLEGLAFSPGGAFGHFLYAGNLTTGEIFQVAPDGTVTTWASGFDGVADIHFEPGKRGGFTMYIVDGQINGNAYAISKE